MILQLFTLRGRTLCWRLVTSSIVNRIHVFTLEGGNFEVYATELYYIADSHHLLLIVRWEVFEHLIDRALFSNDQPHRSAQVHIVLFVFFSFTLSFCLNIGSLGDSSAVTIWNLIELGLFQEGLIVGPQTPVLMLHQEPQYSLLFRLLQPILNLLPWKYWCTCDFDALSCDEKVWRWSRLVYILVVSQVLEEELLEVVRFLLVDIKILTVEVEQTVW